MNNDKKVQGNRKVSESVYCPACKKKFSNKTTYKNHLNSKKHKKNAKIYEKRKQEEPSESKSVSVAITKTSYDDQKVCLFSNHESASVEE